MDHAPLEELGWLVAYWTLHVSRVDGGRLVVWCAAWDTTWGVAAGGRLLHEEVRGVLVSLACYLTRFGGGPAPRGVFDEDCA